MHRCMCPQEKTHANMQGGAAQQMCTCVCTLLQKHFLFVSVFIRVYFFSKDGASFSMKLISEENKVTTSVSPFPSSLPFTVVSKCIVSTVNAYTTQRVASICIAITLAKSALREAPESHSTLITDSPTNILYARALASLLIAEVVTGTNFMTVACCLK